MVLAGEHERVAHAVAVDFDRRVLGVLGDDREQVAEQAPLELVEVEMLGGSRSRGPRWRAGTLDPAGARADAGSSSS